MSFMMNSRGLAQSCAVLVVNVSNHDITVTDNAMLGSLIKYDAAGDVLRAAGDVLRAAGAVLRAAGAVLRAAGAVLSANEANDAVLRANANGLIDDCDKTVIIDDGDYR